MNTLARAVASFLAALVSASAIAVPAESEGALAVSHVRRTASGRYGLELSSALPIPAEVAQDLTRLEQAIEARGLPLDGSRGTLLCSRDGRGVLYQSDQSKRDRVVVKKDPETPTGVTIWPDWRKSDTSVGFPEASRGLWLSRHHVLLSHWDSEGLLYSIVDVRAPKRTYSVPSRHAGACEWLARLVSVSDEGLVVGATEACGLWVAKLDPQSPDLQGHFYEMPAPICDALPIDSRSILVQTADGISPRLLIVDASTGAVLSSTLGAATTMCGQIAMEVSRLGVRAVDIQSPQGRAILSIAEDGSVSVRGWDSKLAIRSASPSGQAVYGLVPGWPSARLDIAATPLMPAGSGVPPVPRGLAPTGLSEHLRLEGWLAW